MNINHPENNNTKRREEREGKSVVIDFMQGCAAGVFMGMLGTLVAVYFGFSFAEDILKERRVHEVVEEVIQAPTNSNFYREPKPHG